MVVANYENKMSEVPNYRRTTSPRSRQDGLWVSRANCIDSSTVDGKDDVLLARVARGTESPGVWIAPARTRHGLLALTIAAVHVNAVGSWAYLHSQPPRIRTAVPLKAIASTTATVASAATGTHRRE